MLEKPAIDKPPAAEAAQKLAAIQPPPPFVTGKVAARALRAAIPLHVDPAKSGSLPLPAVLCCPGHLVRREEEPTFPTTDSLSPVTFDRARAATIAGLATAGKAAVDSLPGSDAFKERVLDLLGQPHQAESMLNGVAAASDAFYDFDEYIFLRDPEDPYFDPRVSGSETIPSDPRFERFKSAACDGIKWFVDWAINNSVDPSNAMHQNSMGLVVYKLFGLWGNVCSIRAFNSLARYSRTAMRSMWGVVSSEVFYRSALYNTLINFAASEAKAYFNSGYDLTTLGKLETKAFWEQVLTAVFDNHFVGIPNEDVSDSTDSYPFDPYPANEVLFGLQVIHRQSWKLLGYGRGELVKSIPLGPRETQKVSVKVTTRTKLGRSTEEASSFETSSESSTSSKDTSEVVREASEKLNLHAEAEVSGGYGPYVQAKVSGGISQDLASSSRQTKNRLNEVMQKTAGRMKRDTKVSVNTETEHTYEVSRASELVNPNDEVAVTYLYHRLQQRYWVSTSIAEVHSVVFVPELVPDPSEVTEDWIARHGDAISSALLDAGLTGILNSIRKEPASLPFQMSQAFGDAASSAIEATKDFKNYVGQGTMPDFLTSGQQFHERDLERRNTYNMDVARRTHQSKVLISHIRRNILHYMRAIWGREDFDQRMQRYSRLRVPTRWNFVPREAPPLNTPYNKSPLETEGFFVPDDSSAKPLTEVIDPIGPIGYLFNCAIYRLRDDNRLANAHQALAYLRSNFVRFDVQCWLSENAGVTVRQAVAHAPRSFSAEYIIKYEEASGLWMRWDPVIRNGSWHDDIPTLQDGSIQLQGIRIWLDGTPKGEDKIKISLRVTSELEDPQIRFVKMQNPLPMSADEPRLFTEAVLAQMADLFPAIRRALAAERNWELLTAEQKAVARAHYHEWVVLRESGRLVPLETTNVVLDLEVGPSPILEPFKRLHRYIDVLREYETMRKNYLENKRRAALMQSGRLGDPEIEHVSVISTDPSFAHLVATPDQPPQN